jgi:ribonuclease E
MIKKLDILYDVMYIDSVSSVRGRREGRDRKDRRGWPNQRDARGTRKRGSAPREGTRERGSGGGAGESNKATSAGLEPQASQTPREAERRSPVRGEGISEDTDAGS